MAVSKYNIDMCRGPLFPKIIRFAVPLYFTTVLQLLFHMADMVVLGQFSKSETAFAAVTAIGPVTGFFINIFSGLSVGANVVISRYYGAKDSKQMRRASHTVMAIALYGGILLGILGLVFKDAMLNWVQIPDELYRQSSLYIIIICIGMPFSVLCNFGSAILRAVGDTRRPLYYLSFAGVINVLLNLVFVIVFGMDVAGVAVATMIANAISAWLVFRALTHSTDSYRIKPSLIRISFDIMREVLWIGLPAGFQSACFAVSNLIIQGALNGLGKDVIAGCGAALTLEGLMWAGTYVFHMTAISFVGQNMGGNKPVRILRSMIYIMICSAGLSLIMGGVFLAFGEPLLSIFNVTPEQMKYGMVRMFVFCTTYFIAGIMDSLTGCLRGLNYSLTSTFISLLWICLFRIFWMWCIFPRHRTLEWVLWSYPISWVMACICSAVAIYFIMRKMLRGRWFHVSRQAA